MSRRKFNLTERNIHYALDYNCNTSRALASGLYRPLWRRSDSSSARDCRHCARYSDHARQTALSESGFTPRSISRPYVLTIGLEPDQCHHGTVLRSDFTIENRNSICGYQFVTCFQQSFQKEDLKLTHHLSAGIRCLNRISNQ